MGLEKAPTIEGKSALSSKVKESRWVKKFVLELSNMEGGPSYTLSHQLTIGSEVGNIVIADPSVSPRHCTFVLQDDVISVMDHGSVKGTFVNGQKIPPGRYIILEDTDTILAGELEVKILVTTESVAEENSEEELEEVPEDINEDVEADESDEEVPVAPKESFFKKFFKSQKPVKKDSKNGKQKNVSINDSGYATNSLVRVIAVLCDLLIAYVLYVIFSPFDEFRSFVNDVPVLLGELMGIDWNQLLTVLTEDYAFLGEMIKDFYSFISSTFQVGHFFLLFVIVRLVSTLLFGVSISEAMLGVRSHGNGVWKRVGGVLRVTLGIFTGPLLVFDVPAIVSRRTFKEFMTFTHTYLSSKFIAILSTLLYLPLLVAMALLSPLIQGLELPEPIAINARVDKRVKAVQPADAVEVTKVKDFSNFLNMELEYDPQSVSFIPVFKFVGQKNKVSYRPALDVYQRDLQRKVELEVLKTFDFRELLGIGFKGNFFLHEKFPEIYKFVYSSDAANPAFKVQNDEKANRKFADEVLSFTKLAFELSAGNAIEYMEVYTPMLKSLMDYRSSFLELLEYKEFDQIDFFKLGNAYFLRVSYLRQKPFDLVIPLIKNEGRIFKVEFDKRENLQALSSRFYKYSLDGSNWFPEHPTSSGEALSAFQALDFFSVAKDKVNNIKPERAQALYGFYFEKSAEVLKRDDPVEYEIWKKSVAGARNVVMKMRAEVKSPVAPAPVETPAESVPTETAGEEPAAVPTETTESTETTEPPAPETIPAETTPAPVVEEDITQKLDNNFRDLLDAIENKNKDYFGIQESVSL